MSTLCTSNLTSGFIDLATYDEQEKYMYGGEDATAYFVRETRKATWFTQVPVCLSRASGSPEFNQEWSVSISRAGDYLLQTWLRVTIPSVTLSSSDPDKRLRWTRNLMHNLIRECAITFNDLQAARFDNYHLDFWSAFTVPAGKVNGYNNMIGNVDDLIQPRANGVAFQAFTLNLPLPFFFCRDSGVALPTAAIPYNDMRINFAFRNWTDLLIVDDIAAGTSTPATLTDVGGTAPSISVAQVWANYAIVSSEERKRMACAPRDILIEQVQITLLLPLFQVQPLSTFLLQEQSTPFSRLLLSTRTRSVWLRWDPITFLSFSLTTMLLSFLSRPVITCTRTRLTLSVLTPWDRLTMVS
jgi:hypothetical protein